MSSDFAQIGMPPSISAVRIPETTRGYAANLRYNGNVSAITLLAVAVAFGSLLRFLYGDPGIFLGAVFGLIGGMLGIFVYLGGGRIWLGIRRFASRFVKPS